MKKILIFNGYYFPAVKYGGPSRSLSHIIQACGKEYEFYVVACNHDVGENTIFENIHEGWNKVGMANVLYLPDSQCKLEKYINIIKEVKPTIIWGCGMWSLTSARVFYWAHRKCIATLMSPRGALNPLAVKFKWYKKVPFIIILRILGFYKNSYFHVTGPDEFYGTKKYLGIDSKKIFNIANLPFQINSMNNISKEIGKIKIVYISRISQTKNLLYALECLKKCQGEIQFDIYGPIEDQKYWDKCKEIISELTNKIRVNYLGIISGDKVVNTFSQYHCAFLPTLTENYGHAIVEAMQAGCWVLLSKRTTPWDKIHEQAGYVVSLDESELFIEYINNLTQLDNREYNILRQKCYNYIHDELDEENLKGKYLDMFSLLSKESCY